MIHIVRRGFVWCWLASSATCHSWRSMIGHHVTIMVLDVRLNMMVWHWALSLHRWLLVLCSLACGCQNLVRSSLAGGMVWSSSMLHVSLSIWRTTKLPLVCRSSLYSFKRLALIMIGYSALLFPGEISHFIVLGDQRWSSACMIGGTWRRGPLQAWWLLISILPLMGLSMVLVDVLVFVSTLLDRFWRHGVSSLLYGKLLLLSRWVFAKIRRFVLAWAQGARVLCLSIAYRCSTCSEIVLLDHAHLIPQVCQFLPLGLYPWCIAEPSISIARKRICGWPALMRSGLTFGLLSFYSFLLVATPHDRRPAHFILSRRLVMSIVITFLLAWAGCSLATRLPSNFMISVSNIIWALYHMFFLRVIVLVIYYALICVVILAKCLHELLLWCRSLLFDRIFRL